MARSSPGLFRSSLGSISRIPAPGAPKKHVTKHQKHNVNVHKKCIQWLKQWGPPQANFFCVIEIMNTQIQLMNFTNYSTYITHTHTHTHTIIKSAEMEYKLAPCFGINWCNFQINHFINKQNVMITITTASTNATTTITSTSSAKCDNKHDQQW